MNRIVIDEDRCKACGLCIPVCNRDLLQLADKLNGKGYHPISIHDMDKCTACAMCAIVCPEVTIFVYKEVKQKKAG